MKKGIKVSLIGLLSGRLVLQSVLPIHADSFSGTNPVKVSQELWENGISNRTVAINIGDRIRNYTVSGEMIPNPIFSLSIHGRFNANNISRLRIYKFNGTIDIAVGNFPTISTSNNTIAFSPNTSVILGGDILFIGINSTSKCVPLGSSDLQLIIDTLPARTPVSLTLSITGGGGSERGTTTLLNTRSLYEYSASSKSNATAKINYAACNGTQAFANLWR